MRSCETRHNASATGAYKVLNLFHSIKETLMADDFDLEKPKRDQEEEISGAPDEEFSGAPVGDKPRKRSPRSRSSLWPLYVAIGCVGMCCLCCVLPWCILGATGVGVAAVLSNSEATETDTQRFTVDPDYPVQLTVDNTVGAIRVQRGNTADEVTVTYTKKAYGLTKSRADKELDKVTVDIQQPDDDTIMVTVNSDRSKDSLWNLANKVEITVTVPEDVSLALTNNMGDITINDVHARALDIQSNTGSIIYEGSLGSDPAATFNIETNTGEITVILPADVNVSLDADSDVGNITVSDAFDHMADVNEVRTGVGETWTGTLGESAESVPTLRLHTNTGSINVHTP
jgi:hypothetical protein